jgi:hypothetical protein
VIFLLLSCVVFAQAPAPLDSGLFTTFSLDVGFTNATYFVCGTIPPSEGCYATGVIGPFGKVGAMLQGNVATNVSKGTATRYIYVLDVAYGAKANGVALYVYKKIDVIDEAGGTDTVTITLSKNLVLPLLGGASTRASMAGNNDFLIIGTNKGPGTVTVAKSNLVVTPLPQAGGGNVKAIAVDQYGFVTVSLGTFTTDTGGFFVLSPSGVMVESGAGTSFVINNRQAFLPSSIP